MMLARMIMYFCGDPDSWDRRSLMMGMMGGMMGGMGGMMGGMGGGMGGMGGMMGGMGGGMRSVPPTELPSAVVNSGKTRHLPTRLVGLDSPTQDRSLARPAEGEPLRLGDVADVSEDARVAKALRRLATASASDSLSQLVMWRVNGGLEWDTIAEMSNKWANQYELTLAREFVERLDAAGSAEAGSAEAGRLLFEIDGADSATAVLAAEVRKQLRHKNVLGLLSEIGIPNQPERPSIACRVRFKGDEAQVQVVATDAAAERWVAYGKFKMAIKHEGETFDSLRFADDLAERVLGRFVRAQLSKGVKEHGKFRYQMRIENASPLVLNGVAVVGVESTDSTAPRILAGISLPPRRSMTVGATDEVVKSLELKKGVRVVALDLSEL
jgi:hypothetical protein